LSEEERPDVEIVSEDELPEVVDVVPVESLDEDTDYTGVTLGDGSLPAEAASAEVVRFDPLDQYLLEIKRYPPLSREEENELALKFKQFGDKKAAYKLVVSNLRLVVLIAREYQKNFQNILDIVQEGNIGLLEAVKQFDPLRGIRFPSYAAYWIRAYILRYLINNIRLVKVGTTQAQRKLFFNLQKEKDKLESEGFQPEAKLLASRLGVKESEVLEMQQRLALPDLSVDAQIKGSDDGSDYHSIIPDSRMNLEEQVVENQFGGAVREVVAEFRARLDDREKAIIDRRLFTDDPVTLQVIADEFGLSRERIRQIENKLREELKSFLKERLQLSEAGEVLVEGE